MLVVVATAAAQAFGERHYGEAVQTDASALARSARPP
jgi:hypothetical protein